MKELPNNNGGIKLYKLPTQSGRLLFSQAFLTVFIK